MELSNLSCLTSSNWVDHLPEPLRSLVLERFRYQDYQRGDVIYQQHDESEHLYHIHSGQVRIASYSEQGKEHVHIIFQDGEGFGDLELIDGQRRCTSAVANCKSRIGAMEKKDFWHLRQQYRELDATLLLLYCKRVRDLLSWSEDASQLELPQRIARRLSLIGDVYGRPAATGVDISVTQEDLAKMLGVARQSVSKQLKIMENCGVVKIHYGTITLLNLEALLAY